MPTSIIDALADNLYTNNDSDNTERAVVTVAATVYMIEVDNTLNTVASYLKLFDSAIAITVGTTVPDDVIHVPAGVKETVLFPGGKAYAAGIREATVTVGGTAGVTSPTSDVKVEIAFT